MFRPGLLALLLMPVVAAPASASRIMDLALPAQLPDGSPQRPVSEPDAPPPLGLDFFDAVLELDGGHEEAWPWPVDSSDH